MRKVRKRIEGEVGQYRGASVTFLDDRKHNCAVIRCGEVARKVFFSRTPSDHRAENNILRDVRKVLVAVGASKDEE